MNQSDPTDHALAAIASILDHPAENPSARADAVAVPAAETPPQQPAPLAPTEPEPADVDDYVKFGPGPLDAIRFRWSARRDDQGRYFVDETIGPGSRPLSSGPMLKHEVIDFIDARAREAQQRFDALKREMTIGPRNAGHDGES